MDSQRSFQRQRNLRRDFMLFSIEFCEGRSPFKHSTLFSAVRKVQANLFFCRYFSIMTLSQLFNLLAKVLISPEVIGVTIVIALYINIVNYIVRYKKRAPRPRKLKTVAATKGDAKKSEDDEDDEDRFEDED